MRLQQQQQQHEYTLQHRQAVRPLLGVKSSYTSTSTAVIMSFPDDEHATEEEARTSSQQHQQQQQPVSCSAGDGGGGDSGVWTLSQGGSWKKNYSHHHQPETTRYSMPSLRSVSPTKRGGGAGSRSNHHHSTGGSISSRDSASSSPTLFHKKLNIKRNLYQARQPTTTNSPSTATTAPAVEAEQRDATTTAFFGSENNNNMNNVSTTSETSSLFEDHAVNPLSTTTGRGPGGGEVSDSDLPSSRISFSGRLEHVSRLAGRSGSDRRTSSPQKRSSPPAPSSPSLSSSAAGAAAAAAAPPEAAAPSRRSSPLRPFRQSSNGGGGGGVRGTTTTTTRRAMSPNKALFLRKRRQKATSSTNSSSSSSSRNTGMEEPVAARLQPQPSRQPPQSPPGAPSSSGLTSQTLRQNRASPLHKAATAPPSTTVSPEQPPGGGGGSSSSSIGRSSRLSRKSRFGRNRSFSGTGSIASAAASTAVATTTTTTTTTHSTATEPPPPPLLLRSPSMSKQQNHGRSSSSWTATLPRDDENVQQRSSSSTNNDNHHVVTIVPARVAQRNQRRRKSAATAVTAVVVAAMPRSPSTSPPRLDKKDASSPAATTTAARGGGGGGDTLCRSPTEEEVPLLVVDSNSSSSDTSSCSSRDNNVACWEKKKKKSVIPASRVHSIHAAFGCDCDLYKDVLQVSRDATDAQIRIAYFRRGRQVLADTTWANNDAMDKKKNKNRRGANPNNSSATVMADLPVSQKERFQAVSLAYEILCKSSWKQEYDTYGWKLASMTTTTSTFPPKPKADCKVTTSTTITDIPGIKITSTTSTAKETPNPSFFSFRMDSGSGSRSPSEISPAASSEQASSILRNPSTTPANVLAASSSNVSQSDRSSVAGNSINRTPRIRWSEEVEELVYRQDPEESRFKMRGSHSYDEDDSASGSGSEGSASSATSSTGSRDYNHDENGHDEVSAEAAAHLDGNMAVSENTLSPKNEGKMNQDGNSIREEDGATTPKPKGKRKMIVVDSGSIQCRLSKLEKKTFENTFVTAFLNDIDRSLDGLEDSFDGMFGSKQLLVDMDDDEDDDDRHQPASGVEPVSEKVQQDTSPQSKRLDPAKVIPFSPVAVLEDVDDDNDSTVLNLFSELTKPARVLFHNTAAMSDDSPSSAAQAPSDKTSSPSETPAVETRMAETDRAFSPIMHQEKSKDPFGFTDTSFTAFEDAFDPFNDSFQTEAEEKKDEPFQPMTKTDALGDAHSCSTPSCSVQLNKETFEPPLLESFTLHHGSTRNRVPLRPSTPNPPPPPPLATETYHMDTSLPSSPIRGDTIFPRTHSGMSSLTGPASIVTNDTDIMLNEAEGNGRGLCTSLLEHSKDGTEAELGMKNGRAAKKQPEETHDFFAHFISYMDALAKDFQQFSQGPCRVVDEATQVIIDAVVIPEEDLESMLAAFQVEGPPPSCMDKNSPSSCAENAPIITRSYTL